MMDGWKEIFCPLRKGSFEMQNNLVLDTFTTRKGTNKDPFHLLEIFSRREKDTYTLCKVHSK